MTRDQFISLFFIALLAFVVGQIFMIFSPFAKAIFWSAILAFGFYPVYERVKKKFKKDAFLPAILTTIAIFLVVIPPLAFIVINMTAQAIEFYQSASTYIREGQLEQLIEQIRSVGFIQNLEAKVFEWGPLKQKAADWILTFSRELGNFAATQAGHITKNLLFVTLNLLLMSVLIFIFLKDGENIYRFIYQIAPFEEKNKKYIFGQINDTFSAVIRGQLLTSFTQAAVAGCIFWFLGLPLPIFFAAATFLTALIPVAGASIIWFPLAVYLAASHQHVKAIVLFVLGVLVISLIDNIMKPALIGEKTKLPYFMLFFGILGGIKLYGLMGIFLAPVVLSLFFALVKIYQEKYC